MGASKVRDMRWCHCALTTHSLTILQAAGNMKLGLCLVVILAIFILETSGQRNNRKSNRNRNNNNRNTNNSNNNEKKGESKKQPALLSPPVPEKCTSRPKHFQRDGHNYFFSKFEEGFEDLKGDWLEGRNFCREYCMDLVSLETQEENDFFVEFIESSESSILNFYPILFNRRNM